MFSLSMPPCQISRSARLRLNLSLSVPSTFVSFSLKADEGLEKSELAKVKQLRAKLDKYAAASHVR